MIKKKVQREAITSLIATILITIVGFLSTMYFARTLGEDILGTYYIFLSVCGTLSLFSDAGLGSATIKRISEGNEQGEYLAGSILVRIITYIIIVSIIYTFRYYFNAVIGLDVINLLVFIIGLGMVNSLFSGVLVGLDHIRVGALSGLLNSLVRVSLQVVLVFLGWQFFGLIYGYLFGVVSSILIFLYYSIRYNIRIKPKICNSKHIRRLFSYSTFTFLNGVGGIIFEYADVMIIGIFLSKGDAGIYGAVWVFSSISLFVSNAIWTTIFPKISRWSTYGKWKEIETSFGMASTYSLILAIPILFGGIVLGRDLLYYAYGPSFADGTLTLTIILFMRLFQVQGNLTLQYLQGIDRPDLVFRIRLFTATLNVVLDWVLIKRYGIEGAAVATLITISIAFILGSHYLKTIINITTKSNTIVAMLLASCIMSIAIYIIKTLFSGDNVIWVLSEVAIGAIIYSIILIGVNKEVRDELWNLRTIKLM